jgi:DNA-binding transcriptional MerR regulator
MYKIGELSKRFHLSRSTLLYYDSIGLLKPSHRTESAYRLYGVDDAKRLERICLYRDMGIELNAIKELLREQGENAEILELALVNMEKQVEEIRQKQAKIMQAIQNPRHTTASQADIFLSVLKNLGFSREDMHKFHAAYEKNNRDGHIAFLRFLGLSDQEIERVRLESR